MKKKITIVCPQLIIQYSDKLGSGIPYMPVIPAYVAAILKEEYEVIIIDAFGENPFHFWIEDNFLIQGISVSDMLHKYPENCEYCIIYVSSIMANFILHKICFAIKKQYPHTNIILIENTQGVIGCSLKFMAPIFFNSKVDYILTGEAEETLPILIKILESSKKQDLNLVNGLLYLSNENQIIENKQNQYITNLNQLPYPAWELFPIENYWKLKYAHGPMQNNYLAILTSRGCPFNCNFCVVPSMNHNKWRSRTPENVVNEIIYMKEKIGVNEFHWEDLNPTSSEERIINICNLLIDRNVNITWKLVSGSKIETISIETLSLMYKAGCRYISFSPESGSKKVLKLMNKPFNHDYALEMTKQMNQLGIIAQACFVLGYKGENISDLQQTKEYIKKLTKAGIDEIALFIMTPIPGTNTFNDFSGYSDFSELTFSPEWRTDYNFLSKFRMHCYKIFFIYKILYHPIKTFKHILNLYQKNFETKAEMNIFRILKLKKVQKNKTNQHENCSY